MQRFMKVATRVADKVHDMRAKRMVTLSDEAIAVRHLSSCFVLCPSFASAQSLSPFMPFNFIP